MSHAKIGLYLQGCFSTVETKKRSVFNEDSYWGSRFYPSEQVEIPETNLLIVRRTSPFPKKILQDKVDPERDIRPNMVKRTPIA